MPVSIHDFTGTEPNCDECRTEGITAEVSRCLDNCSKCKYGLPAGFTTTYCLHPNHRDFRTSVSPGSSKNGRRGEVCRDTGA